MRPSAVIELKFDTSAAGRAPLGDIASSLVSVDDLLRDLATIAAYPAGPEFREIQVAAITMHSPMRVRLSLQAIPEEAIRAFQEICRQIIVFRERDLSEDTAAKQRAAIDAALASCAPQEEKARLTSRESERIHAHVAALRAAQVPLKEVVLTSAPSADVG